MLRPSSGLKQVKQEIRACYLLHAGFFDPEVGGDVFFRNAGWFLVVYILISYTLIFTFSGRRLSSFISYRVLGRDKG
jgi:hypothetical protein